MSIVRSYEVSKGGCPVQMFEMDFPTTGRHKRFNWFGRRNCTVKRRFDSFETAEVERNNLEWQYPMTQFESYWCARHSCWHLAHEIDFVAEKKNQMNLAYIYICDRLAG